MATVATTTPRQAVVLVAGRGSRLGPLTADVPKCLLNVNGISILENALTSLASAGVRRTVLVVGYLEQRVRQAVGEAVGRMGVHYVSNPEYASTSTTRSLWLGLRDVDDDVLLLEGDVLFAPQVLDHFLAEPAPDATLVEAWHPGLDGSVVEIAPDRFVRAWRHKNAQPPGFSLHGTYKTVNVHRFSRAFVRSLLRPALDREVTADGGMEPLETVFAGIVREHPIVYAAEVRGRWVEVDDENDLRRAESLFNGTGA